MAGMAMNFATFPILYGIIPTFPFWIYTILTILGGGLDIYLYVRKRGN
jgi:hypothetical protein